MLFLNFATKAEDNYVEMLEQNQTVIDRIDFPAQFPSTEMFFRRSKLLLKYMINLAQDYAAGYSFYSKTGYPLFVASQLHLSNSLEDCQATICKRLGILTFL